ncbi:MAG TPA: hypothetical protein VHU86_11295 [Solirubrobacterales bacterium]|nr:hypothetical protein [Solirubrobacterales bacterium]
MKNLLVLSALAACVVALLTGCSESACEKAEKAGHGTHACYLENQKSEQELRESEKKLNRLEGTSRADEEAEARKEFREGYEEAEKEAEFYGE